MEFRKNRHEEGISETRRKPEPRRAVVDPRQQMEYSARGSGSQWVGAAGRPARLNQEELQQQKLVRQASS